MKSSLTGSIRKMSAIALLVVAILIALFLGGLMTSKDGFTMSTPPPLFQPTTIPLEHTKTEMVHVDPKAMLVQSSNTSTPLAKQTNQFKPSTEVFDQVFGLASQNETFSIPRA
jgi:hypothetical protein